MLPDFIAHALGRTTKYLFKGHLSKYVAARVKSYRIDGNCSHITLVDLAEILSWAQIIYFNNSACSIMTIILILQYETLNRLKKWPHLEIFIILSRILWYFFQLKKIGHKLFVFKPLFFWAHAVVGKVKKHHWMNIFGS